MHKMTKLVFPGYIMRTENLKNWEQGQRKAAITLIKEHVQITGNVSVIKEQTFLRATKDRKLCRFCVAFDHPHP